MWSVTYADGRQFQECEGDCQFHRSSKDISLSDVCVIRWMNTAIGTAMTIVPENTRAVFFRRHAKEIDPYGNKVIRQLPTIYCMGYESDTSTSYLFITDDGSVVMSSNINGVYL